VVPSLKTSVLGGKCGWLVGLTALPLTCADCLEILGVSTYWTPKSLSKIAYGLLYDLSLSLLCSFERSSDKNFVNILLFSACYTSTYLTSLSGGTTNIFMQLYPISSLNISCIFG